MSDDHPRIVVVGAGPTGLTVACELRRLGVPCRVVDQGSGPTTLSRAIGMFTRSLEVLDDFGAAEEAIERGEPIETTNIYAERRPIGRLVTRSLTGTQRKVVLSLPQHDTEPLLERALRRLGGEVERETRVLDVRHDPSGESVWLTLEGPRGQETVEARWVVGADGAHSAVRKSLGIEFAGDATSDVFVITDARLDRAPPRRQVHYYFSREGVTVVSPLPDGCYRLAVARRGHIGDGSPVSLETMQELIDRRLGGGVHVRELRDAGWGAAQVRVHTRIASTFRDGRCLLAGDAAHIYGPLGGQGMNGGIQDAHNLAWKLALVSVGRGHDRLLDSYAEERREISHHALRVTSMQARMGGLRAPGAVMLRDGLVSGLTRTGTLDRYMLPDSVMLRHRYRPNALVAGRSWRGTQGTRVPDHRLWDAAGASRTLFELVRERPFTVLILSAGAAEDRRIGGVCASLRRSFAEDVAAHRLVRGAVDAAAGDAALVDRGGALHRSLRVRGACLCLIRADAYVAWFGKLDSGDEMLALLASVLTPSRHRSVSAIA